MSLPETIMDLPISTIIRGSSETVGGQLTNATDSLNTVAPLIAILGLVLVGVLKMAPSQKLRQMADDYGLNIIIGTVIISAAASIVGIFL